jgi:altronate dehydratase small subunit
MPNNIIALIMEENDNVATIFSEAKQEDNIKILKKDGSKIDSIKCSNNIPFGHKIAVKNISQQDLIQKYGETIGKATKNIKIGEHVHVHNLESTRGRGDIN